MADDGKLEMCFFYQKTEFSALYRKFVGGLKEKSWMKADPGALYSGCHSIPHSLAYGAALNKVY